MLTNRADTACTLSVIQQSANSPLTADCRLSDHANRHAAACRERRGCGTTWTSAEKLSAPLCRQFSTCT